MCDYPYCWSGPAQVQFPYYHHQQHQLAQHAQMVQVNVGRPYYYEYPYASSSSRQQRNLAEKQRRDKLNNFINQLAILVPMVSTSAKKLDKTSILRLSATFLRMHQTLMASKNVERMKNLKIPMEWCKTVLDGMDGMLLVATPSRIVYISENVEKILGHHQNDLLGKSLKDIIHPEDEIVLNKNFEPYYEDDVYKSDELGSGRHERRSFFLRLAQHAASRSDQPQYMMVQVEGHLRLPKLHQPPQKTKTPAFERYLKAHLSVTNGSYTDNKETTSINNNDIILVALVRPYKERRVTDNSLLEATKEEWITRHLMDGTIIFADHRISIVTGYMTEEVNGLSGFKYMHKEDVRWVLFALRHMFCNRESFGWSCYRLQAKTGDYVYLRTSGYLENDENASSMKSFICVNTLVSPNEGEKLMHEMKSIFSPIIKRKPDPLAVPDKIVTKCASPESPEATEEVEVVLVPLEPSDPKQLSEAVDLLLSDIQEGTPAPSTPNSLIQETAKMEIEKKIDSPVEDQNELSEDKIPAKGNYNRPSVITSITGTIERPKRSPEVIEELPSKRLRAENRSVIVRHEPETYELDTEFMFNTDLTLLTTGTCFSAFSDDDSVRLLEDPNSTDLWDSSVSDIEEGVLKQHLTLENRIHSQRVQIQEIEDDLQTVPLSGTNVYQHITHLKLSITANSY